MLCNQRPNKGRQYFHFLPFLFSTDSGAQEKWLTTWERDQIEALGFTAHIVPKTLSLAPGPKCCLHGISGYKYENHRVEGKCIHGTM